MTGAGVHDEVRELVMALIDAAEPLLRQVAADPEGAAPPVACSWCPLCALAALIRGEHHDLLALLATQASGLLTILRDVVDRHASGAEGPPADGDPADSSRRESSTSSGDDVPEAGRGGFQRIAITIEDG